jgi:ferredoxin
MRFSGGVARPTLRAVPLLLLLQNALVAPMSIAAPTGGTRSFDVTFRRDGEEHTLRVPEGMPILQAAEAAGLMPMSECRRGNCLSCVATVVSGAPFSLRVSDSTALCQLAKAAQLVPLCSAFVTGPNLSIDFDGGPSKAWDA